MKFAFTLQLLLTLVNQRLYLRSTTLFAASPLQCSIVINKLTTHSTRICWSTYCWWQKQDICYIKKGHAPWIYTYRVLHRRSYWQVRSQTLPAGRSATVCTIFSLLKPLLTVLTSFLRGNIHISFSTPWSCQRYYHVQCSQFKSCYINRCLLKYV